MAKVQFLVVCHMWVESDIGSSLHCGYLSGFSSFPPTKNQHLQIPIKTGQRTCTVVLIEDTGNK